MSQPPRIHADKEPVFHIGFWKGATFAVIFIMALFISCVYLAIKFLPP